MMRGLRIGALLLILLLLFTGCVQIYLPNKNEANSKEESDATGETAEITSAPEELFRESGILASDQVNGITLLVGWEAYSFDGEEATVSVSVRLTCESIYVGKRTGTISVNGETLTFSTKPFDYSSDKTTTFKLANNKLFLVDLEENDYELEITVEWLYGVQGVKKLVATGTMQLPGSSQTTDESTAEANTDSSTDTGADRPGSSTDTPSMGEPSIPRSTPDPDEPIERSYEEPLPIPFNNRS